MPRTLFPPPRTLCFSALLVLTGTGAWAARPTAGPPGAAGGSPAVAPLPVGVRAVWELEKAAREATPTRERVCLNGLWRWQPAGGSGAEAAAETVPTGRWGHFKVPGSWPGITDYMQKETQTVFAHPDWQGDRLGSVTTAWYEREITVPPDWTGRRIALSAEYVNSLAAVYVDGRKTGELRFPGGDLDLTGACRPGGRHRLSLRVTALPLKGVLVSYTDTAAAREVKGTVQRRGLCGDVYLVSTPRRARLEGVRVRTSVQDGALVVEAEPRELDGGAAYVLRAQVRDGDRVVRELASPAFTAADVREGWLPFTAKWKPAKRWDLHTPQNQYTLSVTLAEAKGRTLDTAWPQLFGFREIRIEGRDFYLNGSRIFLSAVPLDNAQVSAAAASYAGARESLERLKSFGINFVYTHNYGCEPGSHLSFAEILRAADDVGMLVGLSQPHFSHYDWGSPAADRENGYARHAEFYTRAAGTHPSVVAYSMSHNATGYGEDMNPDLIDGVTDPREPGGARNNARLALRAEAIVKGLDPERIVYHHSSGNLGAMWTNNFYTNFAPIQELSDWFEHWATRGVKPAFLVEYGVPFSWDWAMYRGWYQGQRDWGSAAVPWEFCLAEWNAQFLGDRAYRISEMEKANLRWEAAQFRAGKLWHRWDYPHALGSSVFDERAPVFAAYLTDNWRAYRTWGVSAVSPWEHAIFWKLRPGVDRSRKELPVDWERLQRPGFSPDYLHQRYEVIEHAYERADWVPTEAGQAVIRNNRPLLAYIGGKPARFTSKDHNFLPGETVEKQLILINNSRETVSGDCRWSLALPRAAAGRKEVRIPTGEQARIPLRFTLPAGLVAGRYELEATVRFSSGETQRDTFAVDVLAPPAALPAGPRIALFDPRGETARLLDSLGLRYSGVDAGADLASYDVLVIGKGALTREGAAPDVRRVRDGLKVIVFEQSAEALEQRFGFRVAEYGLRQVFPRVPDHPLLSGLAPATLHDWRGEATLSTPRLEYTLRPRYGPTVKWAGLDVPRIWRCGNRGSVASVLIEKPARGDFLPVVDGGYSLQYSPLLEYREGRGMVLFCQMDVTGRTEGDPAAAALARSLLRYAAGWQAPEPRKAFYTGDPAGRDHLEAAGFAVTPYERGRLVPGGVLVVGPGGGRRLAGRGAELWSWLRGGGRLLGLGLEERDVDAFRPFRFSLHPAEHIAAYFDPPAADSPLRGVSPADVHNRDPRELPHVSGPAAVGTGVLARLEGAEVVFSQMAPWQFDAAKSMNLKRTFRRAAALTARLAANAGVPSTTPLLERFGSPAAPGGGEKRWLAGFYLDTPEEWDDPYRFFRW